MTILFYSSPYELIDKHNDSEIYIPASVSLRMGSPIRMTPPPLPQRNNNYSPPPRMAPISNSRSSPPTPEVTQAFPNTPSPISPIIATNNELKVCTNILFTDFNSSLVLKMLSQCMQHCKVYIPISILTS